MPVKCPSCHAENPETARFCLDCGTLMTSAKIARPALTKTIESPTRVVAPGTVFAGRYEILDGIGAGGMGEVYRAHDEQLDRDVALEKSTALFPGLRGRQTRAFLTFGEGWRWPERTCLML